MRFRDGERKKSCFQCYENTVTPNWSANASVASQATVIYDTHRFAMRTRIGLCHPSHGLAISRQIYTFLIRCRLNDLLILTICFCFSNSVHGCLNFIAVISRKSKPAPAKCSTLLLVCTITKRILYTRRATLAVHGMLSFNNNQFQ